VISQHRTPADPPPVPSPPPPPGDLIELPELASASIEHRLGYFRDDPVVIFGYCPGGAEVIWRDGHSSGFGTGGWRTFLLDIAPLALRHGVHLGDLTHPGTHVLLMDRPRQKTYATTRPTAEAHLARTYGTALRTKRCLCSRTDCAACPLRDVCPSAPVHP
jgi:hypothetical protein